MAQRRADRARLFHLREKAAALGVTAHRRAAPCRRPHGRDQRADDKAACANTLGEPLQIVGTRIDVDVGIEQKQIDAVVSDAVHFGGGGQVQHRIQIDRRLRVGSLADESRPHRVVQCGFGVCHKNVLCVPAPLRQEVGLSGFPGPKCFSITSGSDSLRLTIRTPAAAASAVTNSSSSVISPKRIIAGVET